MILSSSLRWYQSAESQMGAKLLIFRKKLSGFDSLAFPAVHRRRTGNAFAVQFMLFPSQRFALRIPSWSRAMIHLQILADPSTMV